VSRRTPAAGAAARHWLLPFALGNASRAMEGHDGGFSVREDHALVRAAGSSCGLPFRFGAGFDALTRTPQRVRAGSSAQPRRRSRNGGGPRSAGGRAAAAADWCRRGSTKTPATLLSGVNGRKLAQLRARFALARDSILGRAGRKTPRGGGGRSGHLHRETTRRNRHGHDARA